MATAEYNDGFNGGTIAALAILYAHGEPVAWREIVEAAGTHEILVHALTEEGDWEWAGFAAFAVSELGQNTVTKARATARRVRAKKARAKTQEGERT